MPDLYISLGGGEKGGEEELNTLTRLLDALPLESVRSFDNYLASPFFNKDARLLEFFNRVQDAKLSKTGRINAASLFKKHPKPGKHYDAADFAALLKELRQHLMDFIAHQKLKQDESTKLAVLYACLRNQNVLSSELRKLADKRRKLLHKKPIDLAMLMEDLLIDHQEYYSFDNDHELQGLEKIKALHQKLKAFYTAASIMYECEELHIKRSVANLIIEENNQPLHSFDDITQLYELHKHVLEASPSEISQPLEAFKTLFEAKRDKISVNNAYILAKYTAYAIYRASVYVEDMDRIYFYWLQRATDLSAGLIRRIPSGEFLNMISLACFLNELPYAREYLEKCKPLLDAQTAELAERIAELYLLYAEGKYLLVLENIDKNFKRYFEVHYSYLIRVKITRIKAAMEIELSNIPVPEKYDYEYNMADNDLQQFIYRKQDELPQNALDRYSNFQEVYREIVRLKQKHTKKTDKTKAAKKIIEEIQQTSPLILRSWLKQKVEQYFL